MGKDLMCLRTMDGVFLIWVQGLLQPVSATDIQN